MTIGSEPHSPNARYGGGFGPADIQRRTPAHGVRNVRRRATFRKCCRGGPGPVVPFGAGLGVVTPLSRGEKRLPARAFLVAPRPYCYEVLEGPRLQRTVGLRSEGERAAPIQPVPAGRFGTSSSGAGLADRDFAEEQLE
jgi:hypothetical protein